MITLNYFTQLRVTIARSCYDNKMYYYLQMEDNKSDHLPGLYFQVLVDDIHS